MDGIVRGIGHATKGDGINSDFSARQNAVVKRELAGNLYRSCTDDLHAQENSRDVREMRVSPREIPVIRIAPLMQARWLSRNC